MTITWPIVLLLLVAVPAAAAKIKFTINAGDVARHNEPCAATLSADTEPQSHRWCDLIPQGGEPIIGQVHRDGERFVVRWIEPNLAAGKSKTYELTPHKGQLELFHCTLDADTRDLVYGDKPVLRDMIKYDPADRDNTFKTYTHVFDFHDPSVFITKGPGGKYTHHRGIFFGFKAFDGKTLLGDFWHCNDGESERHVECDHTPEFLGPVAAREVEATDWVAKDGKPVVRDTRQYTTWRVSPTKLVIDAEITVESLIGKPIQLGGDAHHAGWHFRAAQEVAEVKNDAGKESGTKYIRPPTAKLTRDDIYADCAWVHASFDIKGHHYQVTHMDGPGNPTPTTYSTRPYGRVGAFFTTEVPADKPLHLRYRLVIAEGDPPTPEELAAAYQSYMTPVKTTP